MVRLAMGRRPLGLAFCAMLAAGLAGCGQPKGGGGSGAPAAKADISDPKLAALVKGARSEGTLVFVNSFQGGGALISRLERGFDAYYGLGAKVVNRTTANMPAEAGKVMEEFRGKRTASIDAMVGSENNVMPLMGAGAVLPADWSWSKTLKGVSTWGGGGVVPVATRIPGITYSLDRVKGAAIPQTMAAFVDSRQPIATTAYGAATNVYAQPEIWGEAKATAFVRKLSANAKGVISCGQTARILSGEFDMFGPNCGISEVLTEVKKGAPLGYVVPRDAPVLGYMYVAIPANAAHPNTAKLWAEYLLTREAQDALYETESTDYHKLAGSKTAAVVQKLQADGVKFVDVDISFFKAHAESLMRTRAEFQKILQRK